MSRQEIVPQTPKLSTATLASEITTMNASKAAAPTTIILAALLALMATLMPTTPARAADSVVLGGTNTFQVSQTGYIDVTLPTTAVFISEHQDDGTGVLHVGSLAISGLEEGRIGGFYLRGMSVAADAYAHTVPVVTDGFGSLSFVATGEITERRACSLDRCDIPAGDYRLYLITPDQDVTVTVTLDGLPGTTSVDLTDEDADLLTPVDAEQQTVTLDDVPQTDAATAAGYWGASASAVLPTDGLLIQTAPMPSPRLRDPSDTLTRPGAGTYTYCAYGTTEPDAVLPGCPDGTNFVAGNAVTPSGTFSFLGTRSFGIAGRPDAQHLGFHGTHLGQNILSASNAVLALPFD